MIETYRRNPTIESSSMRAESLLFDPDSNKFCLLNETAAFLWERLAEPATTAELVSEVCGTFEGVEAAQAERDVKEWLSRLDELSFVAVETSS